MQKHPKKLKLRGFNNLTKSLSFNIYDICYAKSRADRTEYLAYLDEAYNSTRLETILRGVAALIGATILNISSQDYEPMGASVTVLIAEGPMQQKGRRALASPIWTRAICAPTPTPRPTSVAASPPSGSTSTSPPAGRSPPCGRSTI